MSDDGNFKGHGGKPGRNKSKVVSFSAHKNRHNPEPGPARTSGTSVTKQTADFFNKKLTGLTLFDFDPEETSQFRHDYRDDEPTGANATDIVDLEEAAAAVRESAALKAFDGETTLADALPCENTRRKSMRWGLEPQDGEGGSSILSSTSSSSSSSSSSTSSQSLGAGSSEISPDYSSPSTYDPAKIKARQRRERKARAAEWREKTGSSGSLIESFFHALNGLAKAFETERNVRIHCGIAVVVVCMALALRVDAGGCVGLILATGFVLFAEYVNTAVEHVTDIQADFRYHPSARLAKDTAAGAVVIAAFTAVLVGAIVFAPRLWALACGTL